MLGFLALMLVVGAATLWFRRALGVRLPENRAGFVAAWLGGALLGVVALVQGVGWLDQSENYQRRSDPEYVLGALQEHLG